MIARRDVDLSPDVGRNPLPGSTPRPQRTDLVQMVWRQRWIVLLTTILCLGGGFAYITRAVPIYSSSSRVYVQQSGPKIIAESQDYTAGSNYLYTQCELIKATGVLTAIADDPETRAMKTFAHADNIVGYLRSQIVAQVDKQNDIITVSCESPYATEAATIVNKVVDGYVTAQSAQKRSTAAEVLRILEKEKAKRDVELADQMKKIADFKTAHPSLSFQGGERGGNVITEALARLSEALTTARLSTIEAKTTYELLSRRHQQGQAKFGSADATALHVKLRDLQEAREILSRDLGPANKQVQALNAQIERVQRDVAEEDQNATDAGLASIQQQWDIAVQKEKEIQRQVDDQEVAAVKLNSVSAQYGLLAGDLDRVQKISDIIDSRIKELNVTEDVGALNITILDTAHAAGAPVKPEKNKVMGMALLLGLMLGAGFGLLRESMDQRLQSSAEAVTQAIGLPVLGVVPHMTTEVSIVERGQALHLEPMSEIAEAYRTIRTAVFFGIPSEAKTILVTSPCPGDGKTTSASNIAIALAQAGHRTLLLDADFRKPTQHKVFELDDKRGVCSVISRQHKLKHAIQRTAIEGLHVLPCGPIPSNPAEILNGKAFAKVVEVLGAAYDRIVFDSAPVVPVADGRILAAFCDITLMVLRAERSTVKLSNQELARKTGKWCPVCSLHILPSRSPPI